MKALFIGGTGNVSSAVTRLASERGIEVSLLNRGRRGAEVRGARQLIADVTDRASLESALSGLRFDVVVNFIAFRPSDVERDLALFEGRTAQYVFVSSASAYQKPPACPVITERTPLENPYWEYSRDKIACEERLFAAHRGRAFPVTVVRPSLTYDTVIPVPLGGWTEYTIVDRMKRGREIVVHGDGTSLWTVTHAEDFARGFVGLLGHPRAIGEAFHITSDELLTWDQIHRAIARAAGVEARIVHVPSELIAREVPEVAGSLLGDKAHSVIFDNTKVRSLVPDFRARVAFEDGIRRTLAWFEAEPSRCVVSSASDARIDRILARYARAFDASGG